MQANPKPNSETNLRTTGGHIHIGYNTPDMLSSIEMIKYMDIFLGLPSLFIDTDMERRKLYGKAGCFRLKPYGFEYRTLSSFWIAKEKYMHLVFNSSHRAVSSFEHHIDIKKTERDVENAINNADLKAAQDLMSYYNVENIAIKKKTKEKQAT